MSTRQVMIFSRFERFWHWSQMALIMLLMFSGFGLHGLHDLLAFDTAVTLHTYAALALMVLWLFAVFWHLTTGSWRHYLPTTRGLLAVIRFYAYGNLRGERHPYRKAYWRKHNPPQALTYLSLKLVLFPAIWVSGIAYLLYPLWNDLAGASGVLYWIAQVHLVAAFAILAFVIVHVYLLTLGGPVVEHVKPMVTGFDRVELSPEEEAYLERDEPGHIR
jgi:thiosulfate reductase cytochrome b subunit